MVHVYLEVGEAPVSGSDIKLFVFLLSAYFKFWVAYVSVARRLCFIVAIKCSISKYDIEFI